MIMISLLPHSKAQLLLLLKHHYILTNAITSMINVWLKEEVVDLKYQCNAQGIVLYLLSDPPNLYFLFSPSYSVVMQLCHWCHFPNLLLLQSLLVHLCLSPELIGGAHILFSLLLCWAPLLLSHVFSPCHLAYLHMVFDCSGIVYCSIQPSTICFSPQYFLCLCILTC